MRYLSIVVFINKLVSININYVFKRYFCYGIFIFYVIILLNFCIKLLPIHIFTAFLISLYHNFVNISSVVVQICPWVWFCKESISKNAFRPTGEILPQLFILHQRSDFIIHFSLKIRVWDK